LKKLLLFSIAPLLLSYSAQADSIGGCEIKDYGNGVMYFGCDWDTLGSALSEFLTKHPDLEIGSTVPVGGSTLFSTLSVNRFIVTLRKR
jgi:hypothetical protein